MAPDPWLAPEEDTMPTNPIGADQDLATLARLRGVAGIDVDAGLAFLGQSAELYARLLNRFVALHEEDMRRLVELAGQGDADRVHRLAHTIKGGAATLGLLAIAQDAQQLEQALRDQAPLETVVRRSRQMAAGHAELKALLGSSPATLAPHQPVTVDWNRAAAGVQSLAALLAEHDLRAVDQFRACEDLLAAALGERVSAIRSQIESFQFEHALSSLRAAAGAEPRLGRGAAAG
jgi:HPt (histidine-containing phosphotransfer) domain-containing protein